MKITARCTIVLCAAILLFAFFYPVTDSAFAEDIFFKVTWEATGNYKETWNYPGDPNNGSSYYELNAYLSWKVIWPEVNLMPEKRIDYDTDEFIELNGTYEQNGHWVDTDGGVHPIACQGTLGTSGTEIQSLYVEPNVLIIKNRIQIDAPPTAWIFGTCTVCELLSLCHEEGDWIHFEGYDYTDNDTGVILSQPDIRANNEIYEEVSGNYAVDAGLEPYMTASFNWSGSITFEKLPDICSLEQIYGEHSEETELLRHFRDNVLSKSPEGQELIKVYYEWSPAIVKVMAADGAFKEDIKNMIDGVLPLIR
jgi:hypothetical protein